MGFWMAWDTAVIYILIDTECKNYGNGFSWIRVHDILKQEFYDYLYYFKYDRVRKKNKKIKFLLPWGKNFEKLLFKNDVYSKNMSRIFIFAFPLVLSARLWVGHSLIQDISLHRCRLDHIVIKKQLLRGLYMILQLFSLYDI